MDQESEKRAAARAAAELVEDGMVVGLGTGTTVDHLLPALARLNLSIRCVASSPRTEEAARDLGLDVVEFGSIEHLDLTIDGADQVAPDGWLVKGGGAAHTREKVVAAAASRFVVIADSTKVVDALRPPIPLELLEFGLAATLVHVSPAQLRDVSRTPDGGRIADYTGEVDEPAALAARLSATPGVVEHGLFPPTLLSVVLIGRGTTVERRDLP
ncbi:MAG: ribose-5-phosphate isomerase RpiA [Ilumatobacteraceae bacterium]